MSVRLRGLPRRDGFSHERTVRELIWTPALRGDRYEQGHGCLRDASGQHCCLGVLAEEAVAYGVISHFQGEAGGLWYEFDLVRRWAGLRSPEGEYGHDWSLTRDNDGDGHDWDCAALPPRAPLPYSAIADIIESNPPGLCER